MVTSNPIGPYDKYEYDPNPEYDDGVTVPDGSGAIDENPADAAAWPDLPLTSPAELFGDDDAARGGYGPGDGF